MHGPTSKRTCLDGVEVTSRKALLMQKDSHSRGFHQRISEVFQLQHFTRCPKEFGCRYVLIPAGNSPSFANCDILRQNGWWPKRFQHINKSPPKLVWWLPVDFLSIPPCVLSGTPLAWPFHHDGQVYGVDNFWKYGTLSRGFEPLGSGVFRQHRVAENLMAVPTLDPPILPP